MVNNHQWHEFDISGPNGDSIPLHQIEENRFDLGDVTITYNGTTGLEHHVPHRISALEHELLRTITPHHLPSTDLASVPGALRWFTNTYGAHTPAALIHDYLIVDKGDAEIVPAVWADRYFRFMLRSCGVPFFKRSIMWTGVALRTRLHAPQIYKRVLLVVWALAALIGMAAFFATAPSVAFGDGDVLGAATMPVLTASILAPFGLSWLWGKQVLAGFTTAAAAPWLLPVAFLAVVAWCIYRSLEALGSLIGGRVLWVVERMPEWRIA